MTAPSALVALGPRSIVVQGSRDAAESWFGLSRLDDAPPLEWVPEALQLATEVLQLDPGTLVDWLVLRPLALGKILQLPPARAGNLRALADTGTEAFFPVSAGEWSADAIAVEHHRSRPRNTLVAALPSALLTTIESATRAADLRPGRVIPAPAASAVFARNFASDALCPSTCYLHLHLPGHTDIVLLDQGTPASLIPLAAGVSDGIQTRIDPGTPSCSVTVREWRLALELAKTGASERRLPLPRTADQAFRMRRTARTRSGLLALATSLALVAGFGFQVMDVRRELGSLREVREELAPSVQRALEQRRIVQELDASVQELATAERERADWAELFRDVSAVLPRTAHVTRVNGRVDSLAVTVAGEDGSAVDGLATGARFEVAGRNAETDSSGKLILSWDPERPGGAGAD